MNDSPGKGLITRRQSIGLAGAAGAAYLVGRRGAGLLDGLGGGDAEAATNSLSCVLTPDETQGPYWVDEKLNRSDIRSDPSDGSTQSGVPLTLTIVVLRADDSCSPEEGAQVDVWHAGPAGLYSDEAANGTSGKKYLRGYQVTDANGSVTFKTVYPGWYSGRTIHIHFRVRTFSGSSTTTNFTSQIYFDDAVNNPVMATSPYNTRGSRDTTNSNDMLYRSALQIPLNGDTGSGFSGTFTAGLDDLPASGGSSGSSKVRAHLLSARFARTPRGKRVLKLRLKASEKVGATAHLIRGRHGIAGAHRNSIATGTSLMRLPIDNVVAGGRARLALRLHDGDGNTKTIRRELDIPS